MNFIYFLEARGVFLHPDGTVEIEKPDKETYRKRLLDLNLIDRDLNSVGKCWWRAYTGEEW